MKKILKEGQKVILDGDLTNNSVVTVVSQTPNKLFTTVKSKKLKWDVMTYRLTEIQTN